MSLEYQEQDGGIPPELKELSELINQVPEPYRVQLAETLDRATESMQRRIRILTFIRETLSQIQLDMKYLMFDLDATRQERDEFRSQLEEIRGERY